MLNIHPKTPSNPLWRGSLLIVSNDQRPDAFSLIRLITPILTPSMARFADLLALRHDANRTRHSYYRQLRLIQEHFNTDPASLSEAHLRKYLRQTQEALEE